MEPFQAVLETMTSRIITALDGSDATILLTHQEAGQGARGLGDNTVIDLVLGGHTHQSVNGTTDGDLRYMEPSCYGKAYAYSELAFQIEDGRPVFYVFLVEAEQRAAVDWLTGLPSVDRFYILATDVLVAEIKETLIGLFLHNLNIERGAELYCVHVYLQCPCTTPMGRLVDYFSYSSSLEPSS